MSRSGYNNYDDEFSNIYNINYRGAVCSAMRGKRGQAFLKEMLAALDAMPEKKLIANDLVAEAGVCALGAVGLARGWDMSKLDKLDPEDAPYIADQFGIAPAMARELVYYNDEAGRNDETPEERFVRMRKLVESYIKQETQSE